MICKEKLTIHRVVSDKQAVRGESKSLKEEGNGIMETHAVIYHGTWHDEYMTAWIPI